MSADTHIPEPPDDDVAAAEFALGVLDGPERAAARARAETDPAFAERLRLWEARLAPLAADLPAAPPSTDLWAALEAKLSGAQQDAPPTSARPSPIAAPRRSTARRSSPWRPLALAAALAGAAVLGALGAGAIRPRSPPTVLAVVLAPSAKAYEVRGVVTLYPDRARLAAALSEISDRGRVAELWLIKPGGSPVALGLAADAGPGERRARLARAGDVVAVSLEPPGGAPGEAPTGPVVATGVLRAL